MINHVISPIPNITELANGSIHFLPDEETAAALGFKAITNPYDLDHPVDRLHYESAGSSLDRLNLPHAKPIAIAVRVGSQAFHQVELWRLATTIKTSLTSDPS